MVTLSDSSFISNKLSHFTLSSPAGGILISMLHVMALELRRRQVMWLLGAKASDPGAAHRGRFPGRAQPAPRHTGRLA